jgi:hypothetical protein
MTLDRFVSAFLLIGLDSKCCTHSLCFFLYRLNVARPLTASRQAREINLAFTAGDLHVWPWLMVGLTPRTAGVLMDFVRR